jgi:hypothetical protein
MTIFDDRERAFEAHFAHEEELRFLICARRNQLFARWAAEQLGLRGIDYVAYMRLFLEEAVRGRPDEALIQRVRSDLLECDLVTSDERIRSALQEAAVEAERQVRAGIRPPVTSGTAAAGAA